MCFFIKFTIKENDIVFSSFLGFGKGKSFNVAVVEAITSNYLRGMELLIAFTFK